MILSLPLSLGAGAVLTSFVSAKTDPQLTGTWTTKSRSVITGPVSVALFLAMLDVHPGFNTRVAIHIRTEQDLRKQGFYDPVNERIFEPGLTGFSYSFTDDGHYEEAYYRAISNRVWIIAGPNSSDAISNLLISNGPFVPSGHRTMAARHICEECERLPHTDSIRSRWSPVALRSLQ